MGARAGRYVCSTISPSSPMTAVCSATSIPDASVARAGIESEGLGYLRLMNGDKSGKSDMALITSDLHETLEQAGYRSVAVPVAVAETMWEEISELREQGLLDQGLFDAYQEYWRLGVSEGVGEPRTLLSIAWPCPRLKIRFQTEDGPLDVIVPPTYIYSEARSRCLEVARSALEPYGHHVDWARVPVKLLAVRAGLAQYGRNNLTYVPGWGSYVRLGALCTDAVLEPVGPTVESTADAPGLDPRTRRFMDECSTCRACSRSCPTECIPEEGTIIDATRCLTQANENEGEWPAWVPAWAHNSLVGCMRCQEVCPANKAYAGQDAETVAEFDFDETQVILKGLQAEELPDRVHARLAALDLDEYSAVLGRNLLALQRASEIRSDPSA